MSLAALIKMGSALVSGIDPRQAADQIDAACRNQGGDPRELWTVVYRLAAERLVLHGDGAACHCAVAQIPPIHCTGCGMRVLRRLT